jgi:tyrosine-protein kinase Etk/Wzc
MENYTSKHSQQDTQEISLADILNTIKYHKWIILLSLVIGLAIGYLASKSVTAQYKSDALIQVNNKISSTSVLSGLSSLTGKMSTASPAQRQIALIKSRFVLDPLIKSLGLDVIAKPRYLPFIGKLIAHTHPKNTLSNPLFGLNKYAWGGEKIKITRLNVNRELFDHHPLTLIAGKHSNYTLLGPDNSVILTGKIGKTATSTHDKHTSILVKQLQARPGEEFTVELASMKSIEDQLKNAISINDAGQSTTNSNVDTGILQLSINWPNSRQAPVILNKLNQIAEQQNIKHKSQEATQALSFIEQQIPVIQTALKTSEQALNNYKAKAGILDIQVEAKSLITKKSLLAQSIQQLQATKIRLSRYLQPEHPTMLNIQAQLKELKNKVAQINDTIKTAPHLDQKAITLMRDVKVKEALYSQLLTQVQKLKIIKAGTIADVQILDQATTPLLPQPMHKKIIMVAASVGIALLTIITLIVLQLLSSTIKDPQELEDKLNIPVDAVVPFSKNQTKINQKKNTAGSILVTEYPKDTAAESLRSLRTSLLIKLLDSKNNIINILGASPNIGKSFLSINLAQVLAESGKKTVLICCDLRKGHVHKTLGLNKSPGMAEYLQNNIEPAQIIQHRHDIDVISCGRYPEKPSELLLNKQLGELINYCSTTYDIVIVDTPPVLAVTDACIIAQPESINLLTVGLGHNKLNEIDIALKRFQQNKVNVSGIICNYHSSKARGYSYQSYNYYNYEYK